MVYYGIEMLEECAMLLIGAVARAAGVGVQTLRYYERRGLLSPAERSPSGYRLFPDDEPRRVRFIRRAQALGFTLVEIKDLLKLRVKDSRRCDTVRTAARVTRARVRERIADLRRMEKALEKLIHRCAAGRETDVCPLLAVLETRGES
jgi:DNA-binding transcriptional MerR regulator